MGFSHIFRGKLDRTVKYTKNMVNVIQVDEIEVEEIDGNTYFKVIKNGLPTKMVAFDKAEFSNIEERYVFSSKKRMKVQMF